LELCAIAGGIRLIFPKYIGSKRGGTKIINVIKATIALALDIH
jgi:hypothetical protein